MKTIDNKFQESESAIQKSKRNIPEWKKAGWVRIKKEIFKPIWLVKGNYVLEIPEGKIVVDRSRKFVKIEFYKEGINLNKEEIRIEWDRDNYSGSKLGSLFYYPNVQKKKEKDLGFMDCEVNIPITILEYAHYIRTLPKTITGRLGDFEHGHEIMAHYLKDREEHTKITTKVQTQ